MTIIAANQGQTTPPAKKLRTRGRSRIQPEWITCYEFEVLSGYRGGTAMRLIHTLRDAGMRTIGRGGGVRINLSDAREHLDRMSRED